MPRSYIEVVEHRPLRWTVVPRPRDAIRLPESWGDKYGVCPNCANRESLEGSPDEMTCERCEERYPVAWEEKYLGDGSRAVCSGNPRGPDDATQQVVEERTLTEAARGMCPSPCTTHGRRRSRVAS